MWEDNTKFVGFFRCDESDIFGGKCKHGGTEFAYPFSVYTSFYNYCNSTSPTIVPFAIE